jgi:peroxiredoxin
MRRVLPSCIALGLCLAIGCSRSEGTHPQAGSTPLGNQLPAVVLAKPDGSPISLMSFLRKRPALIYIFGMAECASCSNLPLEFRIVHREAPDLVTLLVGSGASIDSFKPRLKSMGLSDEALIDEKRQLLDGLGVSREPLVVLVDTTGRILFVDSRSASRAAQYPVGHILRDLRGIVAQPKNAPRQ